MRGYQRSWLRIDVLAGLATGTVVIPQAMAYATIAGLPVEVGLYTCMVPMLAYALLGGSRTLSVSTTSTIAVLVATTLADLTPRDSDELLSDAFTLTFLVGLSLLAMRAFRLGSLVENISPATLTGIKIGVGLTVAASQLPNLLGGAGRPGRRWLLREGRRRGVASSPTRTRRPSPCRRGSIGLLLVLRRLAPAGAGAAGRRGGRDRCSWRSPTSSSTGSR